MGNFSRDTFKENIKRLEDLATFNDYKHYVGVRLQQGVPLVDADWNELEDIKKHELRAFIKWFIGNGVPEGNDGFKIAAVPVGEGNRENDFVIKGGDGTLKGAGRCLVEGWDVINIIDLRYKDQSLYNNPELAERWGLAENQALPPLNVNTGANARIDTVYLDVWEREVDSDEDDLLINADIGIETCVRLKLEWVVRVAEGGKPPLIPPEGHAYYTLAYLHRSSRNANIEDGQIEDRRQKNLNMNAILNEVKDARGTRNSLDDRLDESLTENGNLRPDVVGEAQILNNSVTSGKLRSDAGIDANRAVTTDHIRDGAVTAAKIGNLAVDTNKIANNAVTISKMALTVQFSGYVSLNKAQLGQPPVVEQIDLGLSGNSYNYLFISFSASSAANLTGTVEVKEAMYFIGGSSHTVKKYLLLQNSCLNPVTVYLRVMRLDDPFRPLILGPVIYGPITPGPEIIVTPL